MAEEVAQPTNLVVGQVGRNSTCNIAAASAIIPAPALLELLFKELVAAKRSLKEATLRVERALDQIKDEKLKT